MHHLVVPTLPYELVKRFNRFSNRGGLMCDKQLSDQVIINLILAGDWGAFNMIVIRYRTPLFRLGLKLIGNMAQVEDIVQDTFIRAYKGLAKFENRSSFKSWIYQIFMNTLRNSLRGRKHLTIDNLELPIENDHEQKIHQHQMSLKLRAAVNGLPAKQQIAVSLRIYEDLSFEEIAQIMQCPYDTAKANFRHGLMKLKSRLQEDSYV